MSPEPSPDEYRFGDFVLDVEKGFLRRAGGEIRLQPKAFELLRYLVERPGRVVSKTELTDAVWRGTAITDNSLSQCAAQVRRALGDESQTIIRTVARRGYVFAAPLTSPVREFPKIVETRNDGGLQSAFQRPAIEAPGWFRRRWLLSGIAAAAAVIAFTAWSITRGPLQHDDDGPSGHFVLSPPEGTRIALRMPTKPLVSVAPDGKKLVLVAEDSAGIRSLWLRLLSATIYQRLDETQGASQAFWSPDSRFVAFFAEGKLKKIPASGGSAQTICEAGMGDGEGGSWSPDDVVVFAVPRTAPAALPVGALYQVPAAGGPVRPATTLDKDHGELSHTWPQFLPDGRHFLYLARNQNPEQSRVYVQKLGSSERHPLLVSKTQAVWARGHGGGPWLFFPRDRVLMAQPVDLSRLEVYGQSVAVASNVNYNTLYGTAAFSVSENGVLAWRSGTIGASTSPIRSLAWYARQGQRLAGIGEPGVFSSLVLSPDERRVAVDRNMKKEEVRYWDIWTIELATGVFSRLTQGPSFRDPVWSPDSRSIAAVSRDGDRQSIVDIPVGSGIPRLLTPTEMPAVPETWFPDGRSLLYTTGPSVLRFSLSGAGGRRTVLNSADDKRRFRISPDGRWIAYQSNESGRYEVYVRSFPAFDQKRQISKEGGVQPLWRKDGRELFFLSLNARMMAVTIKPGALLESSSPGVLFQSPIEGNPLLSQYAVTGDGQRFLMMETTNGAGSGIEEFHIELNWLAALKTAAAGAK